MKTTLPSSSSPPAGPSTIEFSPSPFFSPSSLLPPESRCNHLGGGIHFRRYSLPPALPSFLPSFPKSFSESNHTASIGQGSRPTERGSEAGAGSFAPRGRMTQQRSGITSPFPLSIETFSALPLGRRFGFGLASPLLVGAERASEICLPFCNDLE